jgi:DNA-binding NarL/FixJ family response regulator
VVNVAALTVICVDDDPDILRLLALSVSAQPDFTLVATTGDATEVLDLLRRHRPDVVVLDHGLGAEGKSVIDLRDWRDHGRGQLGLELLTVARQILPDATMVIFTGWQGLEPAARNVGADLTIEKPAIETIWPAIRAHRAAHAHG